MENIYNEFGILYMNYDNYAKSCEKKGDTPLGFIRYLYNTLTGKEI